MANDLTTHSLPPMPALPRSLSTEALRAALDGRCDQDRLLRGIRDLLGLYWQPSDTPEERARQAMLFVRDLAEFSDDVVHCALREWRRQHDRRPSIAALRQLCMARRHDLTAEVNARRPPAPAPYQPVEITAEERAHREAVIGKAATDAGFVRNQHGQWELPADQKDKPARIPHWSETAAPDDPRWAQLRRALALGGGRA